MRRTDVTDDGLRNLQGLTGVRHLLLSGARITDRGLQQLAPMTELKRLTLEDTATTADGIAALRRVIPGLGVDTWGAAPIEDRPRREDGPLPEVEPDVAQSRQDDGASSSAAPDALPTDAAPVRGASPSADDSEGDADAPG